MRELCCPRCGIPTKIHPDESYYGWMRWCEPCEFFAYEDESEWDEDGHYIGGNTLKAEQSTTD